jgi:3-deoxy-7-phosphoheptulonate synthase
MPVGFKNNVDGTTQSAVDAVVSARAAHWFPGVTPQAVSAIFHTTGNDACHVILRGGSRNGPNYHREDVAQVVQQLTARGLPDRVMVDCSHGNSLKDHRRQPAVVDAVAEQVASGSRHILGLMLESHLVEGRQDYVAGRPAVYGQSITDACLSIDQTELLLEQAAAAGCQRARSISR